jgi:hypothetical protein
VLAFARRVGVLRDRQLRARRLELALGLLGPPEQLLAAARGLGVGLGGLGALRVHLVQFALGAAQLLVVVRVLEHAALLLERLMLHELLALLFELVHLLVEVVDVLADLGLLVGRLLHQLLALRAALVVHLHACNVLDQLEALLLVHRRQPVHLVLRHDVVRVVLGEAGGLEQLRDLGLGHVLRVDEVLVLLQPNRAPDGHLVPVDRNAAVAVVDDHLHVRREHVGSRALVQHILAVLRAKWRAVEVEREFDGCAGRAEHTNAVRITEVAPQCFLAAAVPNRETARGQRPRGGRRVPEKKLDFPDPFAPTAHERGGGDK